MKKSIIMWIIAIAVLLFGAWLCRGLTMPPAPKLPKKQLMSPKDAANRETVALPTVVVPFIKNGVLAWDSITNSWYVGNGGTNSIGYSIQSTTNLHTWREAGRVTNLFRFPISETNAFEFFKVGTFWP